MSGRMLPGTFSNQEINQETRMWQIYKLIIALCSIFNMLYTAKTAKFATSLSTCCNNLLRQADIRMRLHGKRQLLTTSLLQVVNRLVASCCLKQTFWRIIRACELSQHTFTGRNLCTRSMLLGRNIFSRGLTAVCNNKHSYDCSKYVSLM